MGSAGGGTSLAADYIEVFGSITQDPNLQIAAAAALFTAVCYQFCSKASQLLSPKLCKAYRRLKRHEQLDWDSRLPSTVHAVVISALCIYALWFSGDFFNTAASSSSISSSGGYGSSISGSSSCSMPLVLRVSPTSYAIIGISFGYFVMDALLLLMHPEIASKEMCVHHAVSLLSLMVAAQLAGMHVYLMVILLTELTTPSVNLRWWLDKADLKGLRLYTYNGLLMTLVWGVARVALFVPFYTHVVANWSIIKTIPLHGIVLLIGVPLLLAALNTMWFIKIVKGAYKLAFKKQVQQQPGNTTTTAAAAAAAAAAEAAAEAAAGGKGGKQLDHMAADKPPAVSILAYAGSGMIKAEHFE